MNYYEDKMSKNKNLIDMVTIVLLLVGGLLWGILGFAGFEMMGKVKSTGLLMSGFFRAIYVLVGLSAVYRIVLFVKSLSKNKK